jgi:hypothetical protein
VDVIKIGTVAVSILVLTKSLVNVLMERFWKKKRKRKKKRKKKKFVFAQTF